MAEVMIEVGASCTDADGKSDGAYSLIGTWTPESFCAELLETIKTNDWGLSNSPGPFQLNITITRKE